MNKHVQIREIPEETHRRLKARAAAQGMSMSEYLKRLIERDLSRPNWETVEALMQTMTPVDFKGSSAELVRRERDGH